MTSIIQFGQSSSISLEGVSLQIAFPTYPFKYIKQLEAALVPAISMLKQNLAGDAFDAMEYGLAKICFRALRDEEDSCAIRMVELTRPASQHRSIRSKDTPHDHGSVDFTESATQYAQFPDTISDSTVWMMTREHLYHWFNTALSLPVKAQDSRDLWWTTPSFRSWLLYTSDESRSHQESLVLRVILANEGLARSYIQECSIAWLEHLLSNAPPLP
jgi:hypothetical protein